MRHLLPVLVGLLLVPRPLLAQAGNYIIGAQDVLAIAVYDEPELSGKYTVELDGSFTYPLVGRMKAAGTSLRMFEDQLRARLADGFVRDPQVTVSIDAYRSQRVFVAGEVRAPGAYPLTGDMTLIEALVRAGSTTSLAAEEVTVVRGARPPDSAESALSGTSGQIVHRVNLKDVQSGIDVTGANIRLLDGDTIYVAAAEQAFVFGHVRSPGAYPVKTSTTVLQALTLAGGVLPTAALKRTRVIRIVDGKRKEMPIDLGDTVQPGDTLIVPQRFF